MTYTSTALLGIAYIRLGLDLGLYRILQSHDATDIAKRLLQIPRLPPGPHLLPAILHATHALSIPVKLGVSFVARSHAFVWSVQHSHCGLEFAGFLSKWLFCIADCQTRRPLNGRSLIPKGSSPCFIQSLSRNFKFAHTRSKDTPRIVRMTSG